MYRRSSIHPIILVIIGLAGIGLLYRLVKNPLGFIIEILMTIAIIGVIFLLYRLIMQKRAGSGFSQSQAKYRKAVNQSRKRYSDSSNRQLNARGFSHKSSTANKSWRSQQAKRKNEHNLTVIDGKKNNKKKNRAFF